MFNLVTMEQLKSEATGKFFHPSNRLNHRLFKFAYQSPSKLVSFFVEKTLPTSEDKPYFKIYRFDHRRGSVNIEDCTPYSKQSTAEAKAKELAEMYVTPQHETRINTNKAIIDLLDQLYPGKDIVGVDHMIDCLEPLRGVILQTLDQLYPGIAKVIFPDDPTGLS